MGLAPYGKKDSDETNQFIRIIKDNLVRSGMFNGLVEGVGPRYCPSIESKIIRFKDKERHQLFIEPEGLNTNEMYVQGMSSALPADVQVKFMQKVHADHTGNGAC